YERMGWRGKGRSSWRSRHSLDRRVPGEHLHSSTRHAQPDSAASRNEPVDTDGFSLTAERTAGHPGFLQSQGSDFRGWPEEASFLHFAESIPRKHSRSCRVMLRI